MGNQRIQGRPELKKGESATGSGGENHTIANNRKHVLGKHSNHSQQCLARSLAVTTLEPKGLELKKERKAEKGLRGVAQTGDLLERL